VFEENNNIKYKMQGRVSAVLEKNRRRWEEYSIAKN
jgi:hypothetical protein